MSEVLTGIERRIYNYVVDYLKRETFQPSVREIGLRFGIRSTKTVTEHLQSLQRKGYLDRTPSRSRALKILGLNLSPATYTIPVYRNARQGPAEDDVEARLDLDRALACSADCFLVRLRGKVDDDLAVLDGDLILVEPSEKARESEVAVYDRGGEIELRRVNSRPLAASSDGSDNGASSLRYLGVARAVLRTLSHI